ncbi:MAG TPA: TonB-dependent siderophore receptor [Terriglobales bacterium]|nr:TonB-dependent siderophore receptor [Terriglobales bacterium]
MRSTLCKLSSLSLLLILVASTHLRAAQSFVTVHGAVTDQSQALIPNAKITLRGREMTRSTVADEVGRFRLENVPEGTYELVIDAKGFESKSQSIVVAQGKAILAEMELKAAGAQETVTVTASAIYAESQATSATKTDTPLRDIPQSVAVINQELLRAQAAVSMQDAVRNVSGVSVHLGEGRRDQVLIRGFSAQNDNLVDGVRDDAPYYRDLSSLERIEVIKGPAAVLYGRGSSGGIVNRITKKPEVEGLAAEISTMIGSYGSKRFTTDLSAPVFHSGLLFRVTGAYEDSGSFRDTYYLNRYDVAPSLLWKPSSKSQVLYQMERLDDDRRPDRGIPSVNGVPAGVRVREYYGYPQDDILRNQVTSHSLKAEHSFSRWTVRNLFHYTGYDNRFSNTQPNGTFLQGGVIMVRRQQYHSTSDQQNLFNQMEAITKLAFLGMRHTLLMGTEYGGQARDFVRFNGTAANVTLLDPVLTRPVYSVVAANISQFNGTVAAGYLQDQIDFGLKWKATIGGRFDHYRQSLNDRTPLNKDLARTDRQWSPRAGLVYQPTNWAALYGSFSRSFQPSGEGLSLAANNQDLKPEISQNYEVGAKFDLLSGRISTNFAVFRLERNNIKTTDPSDSTKLVLVGKQKTDGAELSFTGKLARGWDVYGGYALLSTRIVRSNTLASGIRTEGKRAAHVPLNSMNLWSTYAYKSGFGFGGGLVYNDDRFTGNDNIVTLPGYVRLDATAFLKKRHYDVVLNLRNVGNAKYHESAHNNAQIFPGSPVNGTLTLRYRW